VRTLFTLLALAVAAGAQAQVLPSEPIALAGGRIVLGGELTATIAPEDLGFFNYTDYEYSTLRSLRLSLTTEVRAHERLQFLGEVRITRGESLEPYAMYARIRPWLAQRLDVQIGRVPPTFGSLSRYGYGNGNFLIGQPLAYQYLTSLRTDALPVNADELLRMRGRGWLVNYTMGNTERGPGVPVVNAQHWDTGVQVHGVSGAFEWTGALTTGSLSNPRVDDDNNGRQAAGRVVFRPGPALALGTSIARGAFLSRTLQPMLADDADVEDGVQQAYGVDVEYSAGRFVGRGEAIWSTWTLPSPFDGGPLNASSVFGEARYRLVPGVHVAARAEYLGFNTIVSGGLRERWEAPIKRLEVGTGWALQRNLMVKASLQRNVRDGGRVRSNTLGAAQIVYWF
jgi:hypothetical protein